MHAIHPHLSKLSIPVSEKDPLHSGIPRNAGVEGVFLGHGYGEFGKMGMDGMHYFEEAVAMFRWMAEAGGPAGKIRKD